ncbi:MAG: TonB-dependent receptor [Calditrichia bacterium]
MKKKATWYVFWGLLYVAAAWAQTPATSDTTSGKAAPATFESKQLPEIKLKEYTIVGLAKVTLPHKIRQQIFKNVKLRWVENPEIMQKEPPSVSFQFSRIKPSLFELYESPWMNSGIYYGSYNTIGLDINTQFQTRRTTLYISADWARSDGHLDNAQWRSTGLRAGFHQQLAKGQIFTAGTDYDFRKQGIWGDYQKFKTDWSAQHTLWNTFANLNQQWSKRFTTRLDGSYIFDSQKSAFHYKDQGANLKGSASFDFNQTRIEAKATYRKSKLSVTNGNLDHLRSDSLSLREYEGSLLNGLVLFQQQWQIFTGNIGILYQRSEENISHQWVFKENKTYTYPQASVAIGLSGWGSFTIGYRPGAEVFTLRDMVKSLPFSDISQMRITNYKSRLESSLEINVSGKLSFGLSGNISRADNYLAPVATADSLQAVFPPKGYPGWVYGTLDEIELREVQTKFRWDIVKKLHVSGWLTARNSEIQKYSNAVVIGKKVPYLPDLNFDAKIGWNFYRMHEIALMTDYVGSRYNDLQNKIKLNDYLLLNARLGLMFTPKIEFYLEGRNLLGRKYEIWKGFQAPGLNTYAGLRMQLY